MSQDRDTDLTWVIDEVVRPDSLPEGWVAYTDQGSKKPFYHNKTLGVSVLECAEPSCEPSCCAPLGLRRGARRASIRSSSLYVSSVVVFRASVAHTVLAAVVSKVAKASSS